MSKLKLLGAIVVGVGVAILIGGISILGYATYKSWQVDYLNHKAMVQIIQYNLEQGKLLPVPPPPSITPPPASAPPSGPGKR